MIINSLNTSIINFVKTLNFIFKIVKLLRNYNNKNLLYLR